MKDAKKRPAIRISLLTFEAIAVGVALAIMLVPLAIEAKWHVKTWPLQTDKMHTEAQIAYGPISKEDVRLYNLPGRKRLRIIGRDGFA